MSRSRCALFATTVLCSAVACSLDYSVGPFKDGPNNGGEDASIDGNGGGGGDEDGGGGGDAGADGPGRAVPPSCTKPLACSGGRSCCASNFVPGGTFSRKYDNAATVATIGGFQLDVFEVTVGRFRAFVNAGKGTQSTAPAANAGARPKVNSSGWDPAWNTKLPTSTTALTSAIKCEQSIEQWTDSAGPREERPMNCVSWYEAFAFCVWDGGWLPTSAEWHFAAAAGNHHRPYPWGTAIDPSKATYGCGTSCNTNSLLPVGSKSTKGDGMWNHADLSGSLWEWTLDSSRDLLMPCSDCSNFVSSAATRVRRGGNVSSANDDELRADYTSEVPGSDHHWSNGFRCGRPK